MMNIKQKRYMNVIYVIRGLVVHHVVVYMKDINYAQIYV
jgi:hypothetical protein